MDTRRYRSDVFDEDLSSRTMLGDQQLAALYDWLGKVVYLQPYFICSCHLQVNIG